MIGDGMDWMTKDIKITTKLKRFHTYEVRKRMMRLQI